MLKDLFTDESTWIKWALARDINGNDVGENSPRAVQWCLVGGLYKCYQGDKIRSIHSKICSYIGDKLISVWNNAPERTFADIRLLVETLDI